MNGKEKKEEEVKGEAEATSKVRLAGEPPAALDGTAKEVETPPDPTYVNEGLVRWERDRAEWLDLPNKSKRKAQREAEEGKDAPPVTAKSMDVDLVIDSIFSSQTEPLGLLPHAVPLPQMIDVLTDLWEAEGLFI